MAQVSSYKIVLHHKNIRYGSDGTCWTMAQVLLKFTNNEGAYLIFYDPEKTPKIPQSDTSRSNARIYIPKDQYPWHLDLLRNEKPVYYINTGGSFWQGSLRTGDEEIGEGENV